MVMGQGGAAMSHHYSGPDFTFPHGDARVDLCDLFAFPKPENTSKSIFIMDVHPSVGANPPEPTPAEPFAPEAIYELKIDTDPRCARGHRFSGPVLAVGERSTECDGAPRRGCRRRRDGRRRRSNHRGCAGDDGARSAGDGGWRLSLLRGLA